MKKTKWLYESINSQCHVLFQHVEESDGEGQTTEVRYPANVIFSDFDIYKAFCLTFSGR